MTDVCKFFSIFVAVLFLGGCDSDETRISDDEQARLLELVETNKALWESRGVEDYFLEYEKSRTFCDGSDEGAYLVVEVINAEVHETLTLLNEHFDGGELKRTELVGLSVDEMFSYLIEEIKKQPSRVSASPYTHRDPTFDEFFGFPVSYYVRPNDEELGPQCYGWWTDVTEFY